VSKTEETVLKNGVRPDFQTRMVGMVIGFVLLGVIGWIGTKVADMAERMARIEGVVRERNRSVERALDRMSSQIEDLRRELAKVNKENAR